MCRLPEDKAIGQLQSPGQIFDNRVWWILKIFERAADKICIEVYAISSSGVIEMSFVPRMWYTVISDTVNLEELGYMYSPVDRTGGTGHE